LLFRLLRSCLGERGVRDLPALAALPDDVGPGHARVAEEHLVEGVLADRAGHRLERLDLDAGRIHRNQQVGDAGVLRRVGLGPHQQEAHLRLVRGAGPDLLPVHQEVVAVLARRCGEAREVAARAGLGVALAPDHLAAQRRTDPALALLLAAVLEQRGHEHRRTLGVHPARDAGAVELLVHDHRLEQVRRRAIAAVLLRDGARPVAVLDQQRQPARPLLGRHVDQAVARLGPLVGFEERANLAAEALVLLAVFQIHRHLARDAVGNDECSLLP
jgi:hypothetical protein